MSLKEIFTKLSLWIGSLYIKSYFLHLCTSIVSYIYMCGSGSKKKGGEGRRPKGRRTDRLSISGELDKGDST